MICHKKQTATGLCRSRDIQLSVCHMCSTGQLKASKINTIVLHNYVIILHYYIIIIIVVVYARKRVTNYFQ